jgi:SAM-dependent methyltransferase
MQDSSGVELAFSVLNGELNAIRSAAPPQVWTHSLKRQCQSHPLASVLHEDPYTARAFEKPRGFAGDAAALDFVYNERPPSGTSARGRAIFAQTTASPSAASVRDRLTRLTRAVQQASAERSGARVAAIACGHLRELASLDSDSLARLDRVIAIDHDKEALSEVSRTRVGECVEPTLSSVRSIIGRRLVIEDLDLVYAAGLFDYLSDDVSTRLIRRMLSFLRPGGRLLIGNFTPENWGRGYMESFMDWTLHYRSAEDLRTLGRHASEEHSIAMERVTVDDLGNIAYLELTRS